MGLNISKLDSSYFPKIPILQNVFKHSGSNQMDGKLEAFQMPESITANNEPSKQREHVHKASHEARERNLFSKFALQDLCDPRSPCIDFDRTPLIFDESINETLNFNDTFSDLFVQKETTLNIKPITATEIDHKDITPADNSLSCDASPAIAGLKTANLDPRSPSICFSRTPIILPDVEGANSTFKSPKCTYGKIHVKRYSIRIAPVHVNPIIRSKQILKKKAKFNLYGGTKTNQNIANNNENSGVCIPKVKDVPLNKKLASKSKRKPLGCVGNACIQMEEKAETNANTSAIAVDFLIP